MGKLDGCVSTVSGDFVKTCCADPKNPATCTAVVERSQCAGFAPPAAGARGDPEACYWAVRPFNFNNIWQSLVTLSVLITGSAFPDAASLGMSAVGVGLQPSPQAAPWAGLYYVAFVAVGFIFLLNFVICIIFDNYAREARERGPGLMLTNKQRVWVDAQRLLLRTARASKAQVLVDLPPLRRRLAAVTGHALFGTGVMACVLLNTLAMMLQHYGQSREWDEVSPAWEGEGSLFLRCGPQHGQAAGRLDQQHRHGAWLSQRRG
jgi:hypothetical protein